MSRPARDRRASPCSAFSPPRRGSGIVLGVGLFNQLHEAALRAVRHAVDLLIAFSPSTCRRPISNCRRKKSIPNSKTPAGKLATRCQSLRQITAPLLRTA